MAIIKMSAGNPPKLESILTPSTPAKLIMIKATAPMVSPQITLMNFGGDGVSGEMPVELIPPMASVFESAAVT